MIDRYSHMSTFGMSPSQWWFRRCRGRQSTNRSSDQSLTIGIQVIDIVDHAGPDKPSTALLLLPTLVAPSIASCTQYVTGDMSANEADPLRRSVRAALNGLRNLSVHTAAAGRAMLAEPTASHPLGHTEEACEDDAEVDASSPDCGHKRGEDGIGSSHHQAGGSSTASERSGGVTGTSGRGLDQDWLHVGADTLQRRGHVLFDARLQQFKQELERRGSIDMRNVRALAFDGIPDGEGLRPVIWKVCMAS